MGQERHLFVIVFNDNTVTTTTESNVSRMYDLADCDSMDHVRAVYAVDQRGELVKVSVGPSRRYDEWDAATDVYYASSPIKAGNRIVGYVHYSNH